VRALPFWMARLTLPSLIATSTPLSEHGFAAA
jgi:hypothetical protein